MVVVVVVGATMILVTGLRPCQYLGFKSFLTGRVDKNSPAAAAGLKKGDIIVEINGVNVTEASFGQLQSMIKDRESIVFLVADRECWVRFSFPIY